jgi:uncharacterized protein (TIGR00297 family)
MGEEMGNGMVEKQVGWRKAIPEARDRMQSRALVWIVGTALVGLCLWTLTLALPMTSQFPAFVLGAFGISAAFAAVVVVLKAATPAGAGCGGMICLLLIYWTGSSLEGFGEGLDRTAVTPLAVLFVLTFLSTRAGKRRKAKAGLAEGKRGRTASQVIANLGFAALCVTPWMATVVGRGMAFGSHSELSALSLDWALKVMCLAALAEATADTASSEIGQAYGGAPFMLLSLRRVEAGTDGAITALGTVAGMAGACVVAAAGAWAMHLHAREVGVAAGAGTAGLFFDSLLGATVERKGWIGNDLVNFTSTAFAAIVAVVVYRYLAL